MKKLIAAGAATALAAGALAGTSLGAGAKTVQVKDNKFGPTSITIRSGTTVRWVWKGHAPHNVTVTKGPKRFHSKTQTSGSFSKKLNTKGTYTILCTIHAPGMKMTVKVR